MLHRVRTTVGGRDRGSTAQRGLLIVVCRTAIKHADKLNSEHKTPADRAVLEHPLDGRCNGQTVLRSLTQMAQDSRAW